MQPDETDPDDAGMPSDRDNPPAGASAPARYRVSRASRLGLVVAATAIVLVVALFAVLSWQRGAAPAAAPPVVPTSWQTYHDPARLFSVRVPDGWSVRLDISHESFGDRTGSADEIAEYVSVGDPSRGNGSPRFDVDASPIRTAFERHWYCRAFPGANAAFHPIPASQMGRAMWLFDTASAHFQLDVWIPGVLEPPHSEPAILTPVPTATPLPAAWVAVERQTVATILGSFAPTDAHALAC